MPTTRSIGSPSAANARIGGIPHLHYFDFLSQGRGQVIRLLFTDAGIAFTDTRYSFAEFPTDIKPAFQAPGGLNPTGSVPIVELNGKVYTESYAILRHFSRVLGGVYDGETDADVYEVDRICDIGADWRTQFVSAFFSSNKAVDYPKYCAGARMGFLNGVETHLKQSEGPFVLGKKLTYADMVIFQILHDEELGKGDQAGLKDYPRLKELYNGVVARPNVNAFFKSKEYKG